MSPKPDLKYSILAGQANSPLKQSQRSSKRGSFKKVRRQKLHLNGPLMLEHSEEEIKADSGFKPAGQDPTQPVSNKQTCIEPTKLLRSMQSMTPTAGISITDGSEESSLSNVDETVCF